MKTSFKNILRLAACGIALTLVAFIRRDDDPLGKLVTTLQRWTDSIPQEKIYLHMDKPYYAVGDTVWFKGYLTIGSRHQLSALSGAMYVELINEKDSLLKQLKLPVTSGMVMGNFILDDDYLQGNYRIRAYTQWMRNAGEEFFFDRTFLVGESDAGIVSKIDFDYKNTGGKPQLSALLNYSTDAGAAFGDKTIRYEIRRQKKVLWQQNGKTDAAGSLRIAIPDDILKNPAGVYIHTIIQSNSRNPVIRDFAIKASLQESDVQFFPESGSLVNGIASRVAFKAVGIDGLGINVKGDVTDNENNEVAKIETLHAGMGSFSLNPQAGKTYTANLTFTDGSTKNIKLPAATDQGYVLAVYQPDKDSVLVRIHAAASLLQSNVNIIAHTSGEVIFSSPIKIEKPITSIWINKKNFPSGITQFTLFNAAGEPLNERIAFIRSHDQMALNIKSAKTNYNSKERVQLELNAKDSKNTPTFGNFSVSVIDESKIPVDENQESTIFSNLLLTSDLKGYVEQPNYYFNNRTDTAEKALDNLMLTQGYRRFAWKELNNTVSTNPRFPVEGLGTTISGKVTTLGHKPLPGASVMLFSLRASVNKVTATDYAGRFKFDGIFMTDSIKFTVQARNGKSDNVIVVMDTLPKIKMSSNRNLADISTNISGSLKAYLDNAKKMDEVYERLGMIDKVHHLRQVNVRAQKKSVAASEISPQSMYKINEQSADQLVNVDAEEASKYISLAQYLQARLQGITISHGQYGSQLDFVQQNSSYRSSFSGGAKQFAGGKLPISLYLNGRRVDDPNEVASILDLSVAPEDVAKIEVVRTNVAMVNYLGGPGVLILTKLGTTRKTYTPSVANIDPKGFNKVREFYSPRYDRPGNAAKLPDLRTTIYWNPYLKTDATGRTTVNFYNADGPGTYRVTIEGINADGELGRQVYRYTVGGGQLNLNTAMPSADKALARITVPVDSLNRRLPVEKVYLQTDKPYYNIGDTLWFKSYLLDGVNLTPSRRSGILYVELADDSANVARRISVPIKDGIGSGQIALKPVMFRDGGFTLRAYTNWMQNFGGAYMFTQRLYLGVPSTKSWLVKSASKLQKVGGKDQIQANIKLTRADDPSRPVAYQKVEVKVYDEWHYLSKQEMQTGADGSLNITQDLGPKADGRRVRVQITSLNKADGNLITQVPLIINRNQNIDVQFLPEGGNLVAGIKSVVGFKALAEDGHGIAVVGGIFDSKNNEVVSFMPLHNGMGSFEFTPKAGETYKAQISDPIAKSYDLPRIEKEGTVLHVDNPEKGDSLKIEIAGAQYLHADSACYLIGMSRGVVYYSQKVDQAHPVLTIAKNQFPSGVARFTLFKGQAPLNERAVFIDNNDALSIDIKPNKDNFVKRDSVGLEIEVKDKSGAPVQGNFSLAVTDDSQVKPDSLDSHGIAANLLLKTDLKGDIESPGFYIYRKDKISWKALDNLLLTQGWTGYDWKAIFAPAKPVKFKVEQPYIIKGKVVNVVNKPVANTTVRVTALHPPLSGETTSDSYGNFEFKNLPAIDSGAYLLQAINNKGKVKSFGDVILERFKSEIKPEPAKVLGMPWYVNTDTIELNYVKRNAAMHADNLQLSGRVLNEVKINSTKVIKSSRNVFGSGGSDWVFDKADIKESGAVNLYELLQQKLPGLKVFGARLIHFRGKDEAIAMLGFNGHSIDLRIDGWPLPLDLDIPDASGGNDLQFNSIKDLLVVDSYGRGRSQLGNSPPPEDVIDALSQIKINGLIGFEVAFTNKNVDRAGHLDFDWAHVELTTQSGRGWYRDEQANTTKYQPIPLSQPALFYSPKYNVESQVTTPDYRPTVFWEPNVITDQNGKARVSFYSTDIQSKYTVKVAGIDGNGGLGDGSIKLNPKNNNTSMGALKN